MKGETCRFFPKFPHQITCKDYKVAVKKSRICKGNTENTVPVSMKKRILKQKGGILPMLLPFAAKATAPLAGSLLSGIAGKLF